MSFHPDKCNVMTINNRRNQIKTLPKQLSSPRFCWGSCYSIFDFLCSVLQILVFLFVLILLAIVLYVLRFTDSDYPLVSSNSSLHENILQSFTFSQYLDYYQFRHMKCSELVKNICNKANKSMRFLKRKLNINNTEIKETA